MKTRGAKSQADKSHSMANAVSKKQYGGTPDLQFIDNRPEAPSQRKQQEAANNSPQLKQLKAFWEAPGTSRQTPLQAKAVIQRTTLQEVLTELKEDIDLLGLFSSWIQARAGDNEDDWQYLLSRMTLQEVKATIALYRERTQGEDRLNALTLEDVIESGGRIDPLPGKQIDELMLSSPDIGDYIARKQAKNISVENLVVALDDAEFAERHWQEFLWENRRLNLSESQKKTLKLREAAKIDRVDGFQANSDGKIYMRPTKMGLRIAIHEGVHKYGGLAFEAYLGHLMNEGATDYIAMLVCAQVGAEIAPQYYPTEKQLLLQILKALDISDEDLFAAYFENQLAGIVTKLVNRIGPEHAIKFRKAKTANEAIKAFNDGQKAVSKN